MKKTLLKYAGYNQWANAKLLNDINKNAPELIDRTIGSSFDSIRQTIMHIADAEYIWHVRVSGGTADKIPGKSGAGIEALEEMDQLLIDFISSKEDLYFSENTSYKTIKGDPFTSNNTAIFWHVFNHSTFHRGQIVTQLRNGGYSGPLESTDFISFERSL